jgi:CheY-like chemotaxis protein
MQVLQLLDVNSVIQEISRMLPRLIGEDIELKFVPGTDLEQIKADRVQMEQVIMNLAANARDAMPTGGTLTIETRNVTVDEPYRQRRTIVPRGKYVVLTMSDSGQGIAREHLEHVFEPFYTTKEAGKGTGLGLATVYGIVKQSEGYIWVYSEVGLGTTFKIYLPSTAANHEVDHREVRVGGDIEGCETVLLVEDEAVLRESEREFLCHHGYTVLAAADGEEAVRVSQGHAGQIHLLVTDVVMPKTGGVELAKKVLGERPDMRVLYVSGYAETKVRAHGDIDVNRFLQKPFSLWDLGRKMREILDTQRSAAVAAGR